MNKCPPRRPTRMASQRLAPWFGKKLWSTQVEEIHDVLTLLGDECSLSQLAKDYGVHHTLISHIKHGRCWRAVTGRI